MININIIILSTIVSLVSVGLLYLILITDDEGYTDIQDTLEISGKERDKEISLKNQKLQEKQKMSHTI